MKHVVVDREGMAAEFLARLSRPGKTILTVLQTDHYTGFGVVPRGGGMSLFASGSTRQGIQDAALPRFGLPFPEHPCQKREVRVALIRNLRRLVPKEPPSEEKEWPLRWDEKPDGTHENWLDESWQARPLPEPPMEPKLIPVVTTATEADALELVQTYTQRWPAQENVIREWLIPRCLRCQSWLC